MPARVGFISLGCAKALVDTEQILSALESRGYEAVEGNDADVVVVNTCGFIDDAIDESLSTIESSLVANGRVIVTGCLGTQAKLLRARFPEVLAVTGPADVDGVVEAVTRTLPAGSAEPLMNEVGIKLTPPHYAYLKVSEGCNHRCTFCIIPTMRGRLRSRRASDILAEAEDLAAAGVQELLIISQDTSAYGADIGYRAETWRGRWLESRIVPLSRALGSIVPWVRLHYLYPYPNVDELVTLMAAGVVLPYLDVPLQHADPQILRAMRRPGDVDSMLERIRRWREMCPDLTIRSTFIVGFPGETDRQFESLLEFLAVARIDRVGAFAYSEVDGAAANRLPGLVDADEKARRLDALMTVQADVSRQRLERWRGRTVEMLVDHVDSSASYGRGRGDAPEVDGRIVVDGVRLRPGERTMVHIEHTDAHDLYARHIGNRVKMN